MVDTVDGLLTGVDGDASGVWLTLAEVARRRGVGRAAVSKRVKRLVAEGLIETRQGKGGSLMVELAAFDRVTGETTIRPDLSGPKAARPAPAESSSASVENMRYTAALKRLDLEERLRNLVSVKSVENAMVRAGETIVRSLDRISNYSPDLMELSKQGEPAVRRYLRAKVYELRRAIAEQLQLQLAEGQAQEAAGGEVLDLPELPTDDDDEIEQRAH
jgi:DNA-binding Lrp family transcriptional regulator